jgi:hypothetical protein
MKNAFIIFTALLLVSSGIVIGKGMARANAMDEARQFHARARLETELRKAQREKCELLMAGIDAGYVIGREGGNLAEYKAWLQAKLDTIMDRVVAP